MAQFADLCSQLDDLLIDSDDDDNHDGVLPLVNAELKVEGVADGPDGHDDDNRDDDNHDDDRSDRDELQPESELHSQLLAWAATRDEKEPAPTGHSSLPCPAADRATKR